MEMRVFVMVMLTVVYYCCLMVQPYIIYHGDDDNVGIDAVVDVIKSTIHSSCSLIFITDATTSHHTLLKLIESLGQRATAVFELWGVDVDTAAPYNNSNTTQQLMHLAHFARQVRMGSWCTVFIAIIEQPNLLDKLAEWGLNGRILIWSTKLLVLTRISSHQHLRYTIPQHWVFTMQNVLIITCQNTTLNIRCMMYSWLPYSEIGAHLKHIASWTTQRRLYLLSNIPLFPHKFDNFHGDTINITARSYMPFWGEVKSNSTNVEYEGSDYEMLMAVASTLNFTYRNLPTNNWIEVAKFVGDRIALFCPIYHILMSVRMDIHDYSTVYEFSYFSFAMAKPGLRPQYLSAYYPLAANVWLCVLAMLLVMPCFLYLVSRVMVQNYTNRDSNVLIVIQDTIGMLLGQNLPAMLPTTTSTRTIITAWLIFAIILSSGYRGNLTASLMLPNIPPRPETLSQLVETVHKVTIPSFGISHYNYYKKSTSPLYNTLADLMDVGPSLMEGMTGALQQNQAHLGGKRYLQQVINKLFTEVDGSSRLYVGKDFLYPGPSGWPIQHDAPYKKQLDGIITAVIEAGLYEKWVEDITTKTQLESQRKQRKQKQQSQKENGTSVEDGINKTKALNISHLQGPFYILLMGLCVGFIILVIEVKVHFIYNSPVHNISQ